jgi:uncharacterized protein YdeI (YjbR/CyaY-like superfamily)
VANDACQKVRSASHARHRTRWHAGAVPAASNSDDPVLGFASRKEWERWLKAEHASSPGVWVRIAKKNAGATSVTYDEALDVALCYGWIDGQKKSDDDTHWLQRFTRRTPRSKWSKINCEKAERLIVAKKMKTAGLQQVERAKSDGRWAAAYAGQRTMTVPRDLQRALDANPKANAFFATLDGANRYAILFRVHDAKRSETRARRIVTFVTMLSEGRKLHG